MQIGRMLTWTADRYPGRIAVDRIPTSAVGKILRRELTEGRYKPLAEARP
jgi:hypothetical protein